MLNALPAGTAEKTPARRKLHYAWIVLIAACILGTVSRADAASFGVFIDPLVKLFGWSRGEISLAYSMAFLAGLPAVVGMGWLGDRYGVRRMMLIAAAVTGAGTMLLGTISQLWQFYVIYGLLVGSLANSAFTVLLPVTLTRWFHRGLGVATGAYWGALGVGPLIFAPLLRWMIENRGWRDTFFTMGVVLGGILLLVSLLMRGNPREKGLRPYGLERGPEMPSRPAAGAPRKVSLREVAALRPVWYLAACHHLGCVGHAVVLAQVVSMATFQGVPGVTAAGILSTIAGSSIISRFVFAVLTERLGGRTVLTIALAAQGTPVLILLWAQEAWVFYLFAVVFGLSYGGEMVGFPIINRQLFGTEAPLGSMYSFEMLGASTGMALGGWLGGVLFDLSGTYQWSVLASVAASYLGVPFALALPRHRGRGVASLESRVDSRRS
ncbi:MAG: MFS transporter [Chloroflexi bacterium]|nr:MFS transporter [Chloroflexota bacterium]